MNVQRVNHSIVALHKRSLPSSSFSYMGYSLQRQSGFWHSTVLSLFIGMVIVVIAIYTRQRTVGLLPVIKTAQD